MVEKLIGKKQVQDFLSRHAWETCVDLEDYYRKTLPKKFSGRILRNEMSQIAWVTSDEQVLVLYKTRNDVMERIDLLAKNWGKAPN